MADKVNPDYRKAIEQINVDGEIDANNSMKPVYANQNSALDEVHKLIGVLYIKHAVDGLLNLNKVQKVKILANVSGQINQIKKTLGSKEVDTVTNILKNEYQNVYYKNAYVMDSGINVNLKFDILKQERIDAAVNSELDGELFSSRIWQNKDDLVTTLKQSLVEIMKGNTTIDAAGKLIQNAFNVGANTSHRLMITELTRVQSQAQTDIANNTGVTQQMWSATLDTKTCEECAALDGKFFDINDDERPEMPLHPNDRCCWINVPSEGWQPTKRKDNETKNIIDYQDYSQWLQDKINNSENDNTNDEDSDTIDSSILSNIKSGFERQGGIMQMDEDTDNYLEKKKAEAITYNENTILLRTNPTTSSVFEELIHATQYRQGKNDGTVKSILLNEIEAQEKLIKYQKVYNIPDLENEQTKKALENYRNQLNEYYKNGGK